MSTSTPSLRELRRRAAFKPVRVHPFPIEAPRYAWGFREDGTLGKLRMSTSTELFEYMRTKAYRALNTGTVVPVQGPLDEAEHWEAVDHLTSEVWDEPTTSYAAQELARYLVAMAEGESRSNPDAVQFDFSSDYERAHGGGSVAHRSRRVFDGDRLERMAWSVATFCLENWDPVYLEKKAAAGRRGGSAPRKPKVTYDELATANGMSASRAAQKFDVDASTIKRLRAEGNAAGIELYGVRS